MPSRFVDPALTPFEQVVEYFLAPSPSRCPLDREQPAGSRQASATIVARVGWSLDGETRESVLHDAARGAAQRICAPHLPRARNWYAMFTLFVRSEVHVALTARSRVAAQPVESIPETAVGEDDAAESARLALDMLGEVAGEVLTPKQHRIWSAYLRAELDGRPVREHLGERPSTRHSEMQRQNRRRVRREIDRRLGVG